MMYYPFITDCKVGDYIIIDFCGALQLHKIDKVGKRTVKSGSLVFGTKNGMPYDFFTRRFSTGARKATEKDILNHIDGVKTI